MLTKSDLSENLRLSAPNGLPALDVTKELDGTIVELQGLTNQDLNVEVTILVLQALKVLLARTDTARTLPLMTGFEPISEIDKWRYDTLLTGPEPYADESPIGKRMDYDSAYDPPAAK